MLTIRCLMGRRLAMSSDREEVGMDGGFAAGDLDDVGLAFVADDGVEHASRFARASGKCWRWGPLSA